MPNKKAFFSDIIDIGGLIMRLNKIVFYFSVILSFISLFVSIYLSFFCIENKITIFISNISMNIFAGTIVLMATSMFDYLIQRRKILTAIMDMVLEFRNLFSKVKYVDDINNFPTFEKYQDYYKEEKRKITKKEYDVLLEREKERIKVKMEDEMETYLKISEIKFNKNWLLWDELYFMFDIKKKKRNWFHKEIFDYIYSLLEEIRLESSHFEIYKNEFQNFKVNYDKILNLQKNILFYEKRFDEDYNYSMNFKEEAIIGYGENAIDNSSYIIANKVVEHLSEMFVEVGKINYFSKKYDGKK